MHFKELIELIDDFSKNHSAIRGHVDIINKDGYYQIKNTEWCYTMFGPDNEDTIKEALEDFEPKVDKEGVYQFDAVIYVSHNYGEAPEKYINWSEFKFIETIEARDRNDKLNKLLDFNF